MQIYTGVLSIFSQDTVALSPCSEDVVQTRQGNILGGDFSGNVLLGYKVESGKIVGRVKDTMVSGNIYQVLKDITAIGNEAKWVGGFLQTPHLYCPSLSVTSK